MTQGVNAPVVDTIASTDPIVATKMIRNESSQPAHGKTFPVTVDEDGMYTIDATSESLDLLLILRDEKGKILKQDNNGGFGNEPRIVIRNLKARTEYSVQVCTLHEVFGEFILTLTKGPPAKLSREEWLEAEEAELTSSLRSAEQDLPENHDLLGAALVQMATFHRNQRQYARAKTLYSRALAILESKEKTFIALPQALNDLGGIHQEEGRFDRAREYYSRSVEASRALFGNSGAFTGLALNNLGNALDLMGDRDEALIKLKEALKILEKTLGKNHDLTATCLDNLGSVYRQQGNYEEARPIFERALAIREKRFGPRHPATIQSLNSMAALLAFQVSFEEALPLLKKAVALSEEVLGPRHLGTASSLQNLSMVLARKKQYREATKLSRRALSIREMALGPEHASTSSVLNALAGLLSVQGQVEEAEALWKRALAIRESSLGPDHPFTALTLSSLGTQYLNQGRLDEASSLLNRSLSIREQVLGVEHPRTVQNLSDLARLAKAKNEPEEALRYDMKSLSARRRWLSRQLPVLSERERFLLAAQHRFALDRVFDRVRLSSATINDDSLASELVFWKGLISRGLFQTRAWLQQRTDPKTLHLVEELRTVLSELSSSFFSESHTGEAARSTTLKILEEKRDRLQRELSRLVVGSPEEPSENPVNLLRLREALEPTDAVLDFLAYDSDDDNSRTDDRYFVVFVLRQDAPAVRIELGPAQELSSALRSHLESTSARRSSTESESERESPLRKILWAPLLPHLKGIQRVFICPDEEIATLPFETLPGKEPGSYLIEEFGFVYLQGALDLLTDESAPLGKGALLAGGLDFDAVDDSDINNRVPPTQLLASNQNALRSFDREFYPLDGTYREIQALSHRFKKGKNLDGEAVVLTAGHATEKRVKIEVAGKRYVHLATHGFFAPEGIASSFDQELEETRNNQGNHDLNRDEKEAFAGSLPGLLSGIVLSGANLPASENQDDGILTAEEVVWLDLSGCDLVVLSACETGLGTPKGGENLIGLRRALHLAGARSTITSLWRVSDDITQQLMQDFYRRLWIEGEDKLTALRGAQLQQLKRNRARYRGEGLPGSWGAFVLEGSYR